MKVIIRPRWWEDQPIREVELAVHPHADNEWRVYSDGKFVGTVVRYRGSLDRKLAGTRLRSPGKRRTLWGFRLPGENLTTWDQYSRADCLRGLLEQAKP